MILVIDGNNMAHRARYKFNLSNRGEDVSITYGMLYMINSLLKKFDTRSLVVCWDSSVPEFRRKALPEYKANRHKDEDPLVYENIVRQMEELSDYALPIMGAMTVRRPGAEADDLMYHMAKMSAEPVTIVTSDKDLIQAVDDNVRVYNPAQDRLYTPEIVMETFGVPVSQYVDWRAIQGDSGDNISGVPGIGEKTATKLFKECKTLTGITNAALGINPACEITGKLADNITHFGFDRIAKNIYVMALYADRVGARLAIIRAVEDYHSYSPDIFKRYLLRNAFTSLIGSTLQQFQRRAQPPLLNEYVVRTPVVETRRVPV